MRHVLKIGLHIFLFLFCFSLSVKGQQNFFFSQYIQDATAFNPAYAGSQEALTLTVQYRHQWVQAEGTPVFQGFSAHTPVWSQNLGLGIRLSNDQVAGLNRQALSPSFAYRIRLGKNSFIAAGIRAGITRQQPQFQDIRLKDPDDPAFAPGPAGTSGSFGTGLFFASKYFYAGFAVPELFPDLGGKFSESMYQATERSYVGHAGLVIPIHPELKLKPNVLVVVPDKGSFYADANIMLLFREVLWVGGSYRLGRGIGAMAQVQLTPQLSAGYGYDLPLKTGYFAGASSHEASLQYRFYFVKSDVKSPRYF